jgi:hypothetical protein
MKGAEAGRSRLIDGWGIHWLPRRGWTYNLWGRGCVAIRTDRGPVRIGTDDPTGLERFLRAKLAPQTPLPAAAPASPKSGGLSNIRAAVAFVRRSIDGLRERGRIDTPRRTG